MNNLVRKLNAARKAGFGQSEDISWDGKLAAQAQKYADYLNKKNTGLFHGYIARDGSFDNLYGLYAFMTKNGKASRLAIDSKENGRIPFACMSDQNVMGQNLALGMEPEDAMNVWVSECNECSGAHCSTASGGPVGHYTAAMWKNSKKIGCARTGEYFICNFQNAGNYPDPDISGSAEAKILSNFTKNVPANNRCGAIKAALAR